MAKKKFRCCTNCFRNFPEDVWLKNRGCSFCKWEQEECPFDEGLVKTGDPFPCYIENHGELLINGKLAEVISND